ncbi:Proline/betaine transporter [Candidatus Nitrosocosmicus oleophilus]|jgi:MFS family permease|uniref:Proline/betaine transporter n=1 Tax=Candidatus Nitrosocosmicus oleophilus TaxID=1353260 RepID=A0A654LZY7_9ARCH|nr:MFS transporter [Candidatus Nitrosocosmicus oleophilus]ALI37028.1 Proline/betaine transporter [Candidatus Nitrosocosmicus oleophilus]
MHLKTGLSKEQQTIVFASWFGWALDGYDLVLMLFVISSVNQLFFSDNSAMSLLATFATYIIALVMRPIGGALFGNFGDKYGRKKTMMVTIVGFSIVTFATGLLPTWQTVGIVAPILLIFLRFVQGLFAGGEWASGSVITMEMVPKKTRGLLSGFVQSGYSFGFVLASVMYLLVLNIFPNDEFVEIGWRILFFTGLIPGLLALIIRVKMVESEVWLESKEQRKEIHKTPLKNILSDRVQRKRIFLALIIMTGLMYSYYTSIGFMPVFLENYVEINKNDVAIIMIEVTVAALLGTVFTGLVSQIIGRMKIITIFAIASILLSVPLLYGLFISTNIHEKIFFASLLIFLSATAFGPMPAFLSERFPTEIRNTASGLVYNGGLIIGSWSPIVAISLLSNTKSLSPILIPLVLALNISIGAIILLIGSRLNPDTREVNLN